jgi:SNF2 family DNA or RNA helicase
MIKIVYQNDIASLYFSGENFDELLSIVKNAKLSYDQDRKCWEGSAYKIWSIVEDIEDYETINPIEKKVLKQHRFDFGKKETEFIRRRFDESLLKVLPIVGKTPHENFQTDCIKKGINQNRLAIFLGMGTGKTYIATSIINHLWKKEIDKVLIVAPPEGVINWRRELLKFSNFFDRKNICISTATENRDFLKIRAKVVILTYRHFLTISDDYYKKIMKKASKSYRTACVPFESLGKTRLIILDESHNIKNHKSRQSKVLHLHKCFFKYRYLLTGTPSPNNFGELYSQMKFLDNKILPPTYSEWLSYVANLGDRFSNYNINYFYDDKVREWEKIFSPLVVRYKSKELLNLPELYVKKIYAALPDKQEKIYQQLVDYIIFILKEEDDGRVIPKKMLNRFPYISQALENPCLLKGKIDSARNKSLHRLVENFKFKEHGKLPILDSLLDKYINIEKRKTVVFDFHPLTLDQLAKHYEYYNPIVIHGQIEVEGESHAYRELLLDKFKKDKKHNLLLGSLRVLSTAINLQEATRALYFNRDDSFINWDQSQKRLHRIGQDEPVIINPIIFENTLDERRDKRLERKEALNEKIFDKEYLDAKTWKDIFEGKK